MNYSMHDEARHGELTDRAARATCTAHFQSLVVRLQPEAHIPCSFRLGCAGGEPWAECVF